MCGSRLLFMRRSSNTVFQSGHSHALSCFVSVPLHVFFPHLALNQGQFCSPLTLDIGQCLGDFLVVTAGGASGI